VGGQRERGIRRHGCRHDRGCGRRDQGKHQSEENENLADDRNPSPLYVSSPTRKRLERSPKGDARALPKANPVWVRGCESGSGELFDYRLQYGALTFGRRIGH
jgi:hypothetical protein